LARERLADDAGEKSRRGAVGLARAHADRRQAQADAVEEAAPAVIGKQQLADRLLRAVAGKRRIEELVADRLRKRRAEHRDRRGEHHPRPITVADFADGVEQMPRAVEVDAVALVEVGLGLAGNDGGEVKDEIGPRRHQLFRLARRGEVRGHRFYAEGRASRYRARDHVVQRQLSQRLALQLLGQLAADHAGRADDQDSLHQPRSQKRHHGPLFLPPGLRWELSGKFFVSTRCAPSRRSVMPSAS